MEQLPAFVELIENLSRFCLIHPGWSIFFFALACGAIGRE